MKGKSCRDDIINATESDLGAKIRPAVIPDIPVIPSRASAGLIEKW